MLYLALNKSLRKLSELAPAFLNESSFAHTKSFFITQMRGKQVAEVMKNLLIALRVDGT